MAVELKEVELEQEALTIYQQAHSVMIIDQPTYDLAAERLKGVIGILDKIDETIDPEIDRWNKGHKGAIALKKKLQGQLPGERDRLKVGIATFDANQRRIREEAIRKANEEAVRIAAEQEAARKELERQDRVAAEKRDEEARLSLAVEAESAGATTETINEIISTPIISSTPVVNMRPLPLVIPVSIPSYQQSSGISTTQKWSAEVTDLKALCRAVAMGTASIEFIEPNMSALNSLARAMKSTLNIPGVRAVAETGVRVRR